MARGHSPLEENRDREEIDLRWRDALSRYFSILEEWSRNDRENGAMVSSSTDGVPHSRPISRKLT